MIEKSIAPFDGLPRTKIITDENGDSAYRITPFELTPLLAKIADFLAVVSAICIGIFSVLQVSKNQQATDLQWILSITSPWLSYPFMKLLWRLALRRPSRIVIAPRQVKVRRWYGWAVFDRTLPHKFSALAHDKTRVEQEQIDFVVRREQARGKIIHKTRYYGESFHIIFEYLGQRQDLLTIYGPESAKRMLTRLIACNSVMNKKNRMDEGASLGPDYEWPDDTGDIPR
ncbi:MAG: hypothetical protein KME37_09620 [Candidatus Thiodiazotropha sp. (ex Codakia orbicularis)]|nr:hypothetical protein [Candidatus Thiodiazotropha sp. (ex Codakia orbicularis)]